MPTCIASYTGKYGKIHPQLPYQYGELTLPILPYHERQYWKYDFWVIPGQSTKVFRTPLKNIFFHEKPQIYTILRYLNLFFNTFVVF